MFRRSNVIHANALLLITDRGKSSSSNPKTACSRQSSEAGCLLFLYEFTAEVTVFRAYMRRSSPRPFGQPLFPVLPCPGSRHPDARRKRVRAHDQVYACQLLVD